MSDSDSKEKGVIPAEGCLLSMVVVGVAFLFGTYALISYMNNRVYKGNKDQLVVFQRMKDTSKIITIGDTRDLPLGYKPHGARYNAMFATNAADSAMGLKQKIPLVKFLGDSAIAVSTAESPDGLSFRTEILKIK